MNENQEIAKLKRQLDTIYRVNSFLSSITDLEKLLKLIMVESKDIVNCEASSLMLYHPVSKRLSFEVVVGQKIAFLKEISLNLGQGVAGKVAETREIINVKNTRGNKNYYDYIDQITSFQTRSLLALPLLRGDKLIGVIEVLNKLPQEGQDPYDAFFNDEDIRIMEILAEHAAIAIENAQLLADNIKSEKLAAIGQAVAGTAHYIKNVLTGISGGIGIIDIALKSKNIHAIEKAWPIFKRSNLKMNKLVNDMLTYSKDRNPLKKRTSVAEMVDDVCQMVKERAEQANIEIIKEYGDEKILVEVEAATIGDALLNILSNSIEANDKDRGEIHINIQKSIGGDTVIISITDQGCGIPKDIIARIFEPFFSTKGSKGTGLGLAVARKVIEEHQGALTVESRPGLKSTFTVRLPVYKPKTML